MILCTHIKKEFATWMWDFIYTSCVQTEIAVNIPRVKYACHRNKLLRAENHAMRQKLAAYTDELKFKQGFSSLSLYPNLNTVFVICIISIDHLRNKNIGILFQIFLIHT